MNHETRVCPNCGSTDIGVNRDNIMSWMGLDTSYQCGKCGYTGIFPEVSDEDVKEQQLEIRKRGRLKNNISNDGPTRGRIAIGILFLLAGILPALYAPWGAGKLAGLLSLAIGGAIMFEYASSMNVVE